MFGKPRPCGAAPAPPGSDSQPIKVNPPRTYRQLELDLSRRTGTRVRITGEDRGRVELAYASREELDRLLGLLGFEAEE